MAVSLPMAAPGMACARAPVQTLPPLLPTAFLLHTLCGSSPFLYFLSAQVFDRDLVHLHSFAGGGDLLLCQTLIGIVLHRKPLDKRQRLRPALKQAAAAKHDRALHIRRPRLIADDLIAQDSEAHLIAGSERIDLVSRARAVEVDLPRRFIVEVVDRYGVGVTIIPLHRQHAAPRMAQKRLRRFRADFIFLLSDGSEHRLFLPEAYRCDAERHALCASGSLPTLTEQP